MKENFLISDLKRIKHKDGDLIKGLSRASAQYAGFGESYYSCVKQGKIKAWRLHTQITNNMVIVQGELNVNLVDKFKRVKSIKINSDNTKLLTIYPYTWYGFEAVGASDAIIHNITNFPYTESEIRRSDLKTFEGVWCR